MLEQPTFTQVEAVRSALEILVVSGNERITQQAQELLAAIQQHIDEMDTQKVTDGSTVSSLQNAKSSCQAITEAALAQVENVTAPYVMEPVLRKVVETAIALHRPLFLDGEPGVGKTSLARSVAAERGLRLIDFQCKSTTDGQSLLYEINHIRMLRDAQLGKDVSNMADYIEWGPIGRAFTSDEQVVLLIDEVDKAQRELANDLLRAIEDLAFTIDETGEQVTAKHKPIIFITTNSEKKMSDAFLRRCNYWYINFPTREKLTQIIRVRFPNISNSLIESAIAQFEQIRESDLEKAPSTAELIDWVQALKMHGVEQVTGALEHLQVMLKTRADLEKFRGTVPKEKKLHELGMPSEIIAAFSGYKVVKITESDSKLPLILVNSGIKFVQGTGWNKSLTFKDPRVRQLERGWIVLEPSIYTLFTEQDLISDEVRIEEQANRRFAKVQNPNEYFIQGTLDDGTSVYSMDGNVAHYVSR